MSRTSSSIAVSCERTRVLSVIYKSLLSSVYKRDRELRRGREGKGSRSQEGGVRHRGEFPTVSDALHVTAESAADLFGRLLVEFLPVLQRLRPRLNAGEIGIDAVSTGRASGLLRGDFLPFGLFFGAAFLALAFTLALLL
jgi:hypothetical protein